MRALLDVNILIGLLDADHALHTRATSWFSAEGHHGWASCPITQNGCVRIMSHSGYPNALSTRAVMERLLEATQSGYHEFWPDDISLLDPALVDRSRIHGPKQLTHLYLLALAVQHGGRLVTFDASISMHAVKAAEKKHLVVL